MSPCFVADMITVGSIGIGLLILIIVWIIALGIYVIAVKLQSNISWIALGTAAVITIILISFPVEKHNREIYNIQSETDFKFIYKNLVLVILFTSSIVGFVAFFLFHCIEPVRAKPIQSFHIKVREQ
ncbi:transmembrane protein 218 isoform X3 [Coccinella septempunctata]|uniref:transmembrane protein 218 isoform X3 n=1 Tax=Coccinella septempunctata TaxID=41139 RepID=UPI001D068572|nr:transmembrane protein 218 isoform X3 [Coccinella septempunctata]